MKVPVCGWCGALDDLVDAVWGNRKLKRCTDQKACIQRTIAFLKMKAGR